MKKERGRSEETTMWAGTKERMKRESKTQETEESAENSLRLRRKEPPLDSRKSKFAVADSASASDPTNTGLQPVLS